jgi:hypothetical protein
MLEDTSSRDVSRYGHVTCQDLVTQTRVPADGRRARVQLAGAWRHRPRSRRRRRHERLEAHALGHGASDFWQCPGTWHHGMLTACLHALVKSHDARAHERWRMAHVRVLRINLTCQNRSARCLVDSCTHVACWQSITWYHGTVLHVSTCATCGLQVGMPCAWSPVRVHVPGGAALRHAA